MGTPKRFNLVRVRSNWVDDRPPKTAEGWVEELNAKAAALLEKYPEPVASFTALDLSWSEKPDTK